MLIYIHVDAQRRDASGCLLLQLLLESLGHVVVLTSRRNGSWYKKMMRPDVFMVGNPVNLSDNFGANLKNTIFCAHELEGFVNVENLNSFYRPDIDYENYRYIFVWSEFNKQWLIKHRGIPEKKVIVSGTPRIDLTKYWVKHKKKTTATKRSIGIVGRFPGINSFDKRNLIDFLFSPMALRPDVTLFDQPSYYKMEIDSLVVYRRVIEYIMENRNDIVSYRPHPNERVAPYLALKERYGDRFWLSGEEDFHEWLAKQEVLVSTTTTSCIDASLHGIPIINIDCITDNVETISVSDLASEVFLDYSHNPKNLDELYALLDKKTLQPRNTEKIMKEYHTRYHAKNTDYHAAIIAAALQALGPKGKNWKRLPLALLRLIDYGIFLTKDRGYQRIYNYHPYYHKTPEYVRQLAGEIVEKVDLVRE